MTTSAPPRCSPRSARPARPRMPRRPDSSTWPPGGPTCTRRSRSTVPPPSPSVVASGASTRSRSPATGARWWRSSASPSSAPCSGSRRWRRRSSSATPSSSATASHACGPSSRPGAVPAWRARLVAEATIHAAPALTPEAAGWVDGQVAAVAGKIGPAQLDRLIAETLKRFELSASDPTADPEDGWQHVDPRHVTIDTDDVHYAGTLHVEADLDLADALDLDRALAHSAATQKALGSDLSLDARRAAALGDLARTQTALDLVHHRAAPAPAAATATGCRSRGRWCCTPTSPPIDGRRARRCSGRPAASRRANAWSCSTQLKDWCGDSRTKVTVKPVIDLNHGEDRARLRDPGPDPRARPPPRPDLRVPVVHPTRPALRRRPHHPVRPHRRRRGPTPTRPDGHRQPGGAVPVPPPPQDPHRLALRDGRARGLRVDQPPRPPVPTRPHRQHRTGSTRPTGFRDRTPSFLNQRDGPPPPTMTPPRTPLTQVTWGHWRVVAP